LAGGCERSKEEAEFLGMEGRRLALLVGAGSMGDFSGEMAREGGVVKKNFGSYDFYSLKRK
jgi:hypothetical protein